MTPPQNAVNIPSSLDSTIPLSSGGAIPVLGLGTWKSKEGQVYEAVKAAIAGGYRLIDGAFAYQNEAEVGRAIRECIEAGMVKRADLFVVTKLWNTYHSKDLVFKCFETSMSKLGLDYIDLYLIHWPMGYQEGTVDFPKNDDGTTPYSNVDYLETWAAMEELVKTGRTRAIGLSNFSIKQIERVLNNATIRPAVLQVECHPYLTQEDLVKYCLDNSIVVMGYSPLGSPDRPWAKPGDPSLLNDPTLTAIALVHNKSVAQVLIRFQTQRGVVVIPKSVTPERIKANADVFDFQLTAEEMKTIEAFNRNHRFCGLEWVKDHPLHPFFADADK